MSWWCISVFCCLSLCVAAQCNIITTDYTCFTPLTCGSAVSVGVYYLVSPDQTLQGPPLHPHSGQTSWRQSRNSSEELDEHKKKTTQKHNGKSCILQAECWLCLYKHLHGWSQKEEVNHVFHLKATGLQNDIQSPPAQCAAHCSTTDLFCLHSSFSKIKLCTSTSESIATMQPKFQKI